MHGIVSLLDDEHYALVEDIWAQLEKEFGVHGLYTTPFPHFSYQVAGGYDVEAVGDYLQELTQNMRPFQIRTAGLGVFTLSKPVLYIPIVRSPELSRLHQQLWNDLTKKATDAAGYYDPEMWMPHITLAHGDIDRDKLADIVRAMSGCNFHWEATVNNLSLIYDTGAKQGLRCRYNFDDGN
ncbi:MAG: 2'-5' RNA ligase family protein [Acidobacteriota bacterium]|nr:2'-5' RNA ligase family protein [Acidobacteriota bacterium]